MKPVGILGGTFDPVHHGHLRIAIECYERLQLAEVRFIPLHQPPHRQQPLASAAQRHAMLQLALAGHDELRIDDCELQRRGVSYTIETLQHLRRQDASGSFCLLTGRDAFNGLCSWRNWQQLLDHAHIIVVERPGESAAGTDRALAELLQQHRNTDMETLHTEPAGSILELAIPLLDISASQIRALCKDGRDASGLLPEKVLDYIHQHALYQQDTP